VASEGFLQGCDGSRRFHQKLNESFLRGSRQTNDLDFGNCLLRGFLCGSDNEVTDGTPRISAARRTMASASSAIRASMQAVLLVRCPASSGV
jgi:hypothetical protein